MGMPMPTRSRSRREPCETGYAVVRTAARDDALVPLHLATVTLLGADILG